MVVVCLGVVCAAAGDKSTRAHNSKTNGTTNVHHNNNNDNNNETNDNNNGSIYGKNISTGRPTTDSANQSHWNSLHDQRKYSW